MKEKKNIKTRQSQKLIPQTVAVMAQSQKLIPQNAVFWGPQSQKLVPQ